MHLPLKLLPFSLAVIQFTGSGSSAVPLEDALDTPGRSWTVVSGAWTGVESDPFSHDSTDAAWLPAGPAGELQTVLSGPVNVRFWLAHDHSEGNGRSGIISSGTAARRWDTSPGWTRASFDFFGPGPVLNITASEDADDPLHLDQFEITPLTAVSLAEAIDQPDWAVATRPDLPFQGWKAASAPDGSDAAFLDIGYRETPWLEVRPNGPGVLSLTQITLTDGSGYSEMTVTSDGQNLAPISLPGYLGSVKAFVAPATTPLIRITATSSFSSKLTTAFDQFQYFPEVSLEEAVDTPGRVWQKGGTGSLSGYAAAWAGADGDGIFVTNSSGGVWVESDFSGPGEIRFTERTTEAWRVQIDGSEHTPGTGSDSGPFRERIVLLAPGNHTVRWLITGGSGRVLDRVIFDPGAAGDFATALDSNLTFSIQSPTVSPTAFNFYSGGSAVQLTGGSNPATLTGSFFGPAVVVAHRSGSLRFSLDGGAPMSFSGTSWLPVLIAAPSAGPHELRVETTGTESAWLDDVRAYPCSLVPFGETLDLPGASALTNPANPWIGLQTNAACFANGNFSVASLNAGQSSWLELTLSGPGVLRTRSRGFTLDGIPQSLPFLRDSGCPLWELKELPVPAGDHAVRWESAAATAISPDAVDRIEWTPAPAVALPEALDTPGRIWTQTLNGTAAPWSGAAFGPFAPDGVDAALLPALTPNSSVTLGTLLTGPVTVSYVTKQAGASTVTLEATGPDLRQRGGPQPAPRRLFDMWSPVTRPFSLTTRTQGQIQGPQLLDSVEIIPWIPISVSEALAGPGVTVHAASSGSWRGWRLGPGGQTIAMSSSQKLEIRVPGSGMLRIKNAWDYSSPQWHIASAIGGRYVAEVVQGPGEISTTLDAAGSSPFAVDEIAFSPAVPPGEVLDNTLSWSTGGDAPWLGLIHPGFTPFASSGIVSSGERSWLETEFSGPAHVEFNALSGGGNPTLQITVDGTPVAAVPSGTFGFRLSVGAHRVRWTAAGPAESSSGDNLHRIGIRNVRVTPLQSAVPPGISLTGQIWKVSGVAEWTEVIEPGSGRAAVLVDRSATTLLRWPGTISATVKVTANPPDPNAGGSPDATVGAWRVSLPVDWTRLEIPMNIPWTDFTLGSRLLNLWIESLAFTPSPEVPLGAALDAPGQAFQTGGASPWKGISTPMPYDSRPPGIAANCAASGEAGWLETTVTGPARLSFQYASKADLSITAAGQTFALPVTTSSPSSFQCYVPSGPQTVRWNFASTAANSYALLDALTITPQASPAIQLDAALDTPGREWVATGSAWTAQTSSAHDGADTVKGTSGLLQSRFTGPGQLSLWWRVTGFGGPVTLKPAGAQVHVQSGNTSWSQPKLNLPGGDWTMQIEANSGECLIDQVTFTPATPVPLEEALDAPDLKFRTSPRNPWSGAQGTGYGAADNDAAGSSLVAVSGPSWLECEVPGPGTLTGKARVAGEVAGSATLRVDGAPHIQPSLSLTSAWQAFSISVSGAGRHVIRFSASQQILWMDQFQFTSQPDRFFDAWAATRGIEAPHILLDDDHDGVPLLAEWAFGLDPAAADARQAGDSVPGLPVARMISVGGTPYPAVEYFVRRDAVGLEYFPEFAGDPSGPWLAESVVVTTADVDSTWQRITVRHLSPIAPGIPVFARLRVH